jgi:hypothetical protein
VVDLDQKIKNILNYEITQPVGLLKGYKMIIVDLTQTIISNVVVHFRDDLKRNNPDASRLIKHSLFNTLLSYKNKFGKEYGQLILACDSKKYWRRDYFPSYKGHRKHDREASDIDWQSVFNTINEIKQDIRDNFPYKIIEVLGAEADDVIAALTKYFQENELVQEGLFDGEPQKILICSADHDFIQLQKYDNVVQWSPNTKKFLKVTEAERKEKYVTHIVKAGDDGIPNILSPDNIFLQEGVRQKPISAKRLAEFMELGIDACKNDTERRNWHRNQQLIDFECIPPDVEESIITAYLNTKVTGDKMSALKYLMDHRCRVLIEEIEDF